MIDAQPVDVAILEHAKDARVGRLESRLNSMRRPARSLMLKKRR